MTTFGSLECGDEFIAPLSGNLIRFIKISARKAKFFNTFRGQFEEVSFKSGDLVMKVG